MFLFHRAWLFTLPQPGSPPTFVCFVVIRHLGKRTCCFFSWRMTPPWTIGSSMCQLKSFKLQRMNCQSPWDDIASYTAPKKSKKIVCQTGVFCAKTRRIFEKMKPFSKGTKTPPHHLQNLQNCCEIRTKFTICPTWLAREFLDPNGFLQPKPKKINESKKTFMKMPVPGNSAIGDLFWGW